MLPYWFLAESISCWLGPTGRCGSGAGAVNAGFASAFGSAVMTAGEGGLVSTGGGVDAGSVTGDGVGGSIGLTSGLMTGLGFTVSGGGGGISGAGSGVSTGSGWVTLGWLSSTVNGSFLAGSSIWKLGNTNANSICNVIESVIAQSRVLSLLGSCREEVANLVCICRG